jgi:hypothetical protein
MRYVYFPLLRCKATLKNIFNIFLAKQGEKISKCIFFIRQELVAKFKQ